MESLITTAQWCRLEIEGRESIFGVLSDAAPGIRMCDGGWVKEGSLQRSLMNLNILDIICYQPDHGPNNYTVITEAVGRGMICAFDNDNPYTFFPCPIVSMSLVNCSSFVTKDGMIFRPYIDEIMAQKVLELDIKVLKKRLRDYLNILQIWALMLRVKQLENIIRKTRIQKPDCFLSPSDWNEYVIFLIAGKYDGISKLPSNVVLLGNISDQKMLAKYYSMADVTLLTSKKETFSMVVAESLCCGTPVVGFTAGAPELIAINEFSSFVPQGDSEELFKEVKTFIYNREFDKDKISSVAKCKYSKKVMGQNYLNLYTEMMT